MHEQEMFKVTQQWYTAYSIEDIWVTTDQKLAYVTPNQKWFADNKVVELALLVILI